MQVRVGAICYDGTRSSATGRGACSHHGGVRQWLYQTVPIPSPKIQSQTSQRQSSPLLFDTSYSTISSYTAKAKQQTRCESRIYEEQQTKVFAKKPIKQQIKEKPIKISEKQTFQGQLNRQKILFKEKLQEKVEQLEQANKKIKNLQQQLESAQAKQTQKKKSNKLNKTVYHYTNLKEQKLYSLQKIRQYLWNESQIKIQKNQIKGQLRYTFNPKRQSIPKKMCKIQKNTVTGCVYPTNKRKNNHIQSQIIQFAAQTIMTSLKRQRNTRQLGKIVKISQSIHQKKQQIVMKSLNNPQRLSIISKQSQLKITPIKNSNQNKTQSQELIKKQTQVEVIRKNELKTIRERSIKNDSQKIQNVEHIQKKDNKQGNILMIFLMLLITVLVPLQFYQTNRYQ